jgi:hypothetical protein
VVVAAGGVARVDLGDVVILADDDLFSLAKGGQERISRARWLAQAGDPEDSRDRSGENEWAVMGPEERWKLPRRQARRADASAQGIPT